MNCHARSSSDGSESGKKLIIIEHNREYSVREWNTGIPYEYQGILDCNHGMRLSKSRSRFGGAIVQL